MDPIQLAGLSPAVFAMIFAVGMTILVLRWPAAVIFLTARLTEPSTKGAAIFIVNAVYGLLTGALEPHAFLLVLVQGIYHILQPDSPGGTLVSGTLAVSEWTPPPAELSDTSKQFITDAIAAVKPVTPAALMICISFALASCSGLNLTGDPTKDIPAVGGALTSADAAAQQSVASLAKFTAADLLAADTDAVANSDAPAHSCYAAIIPVVQAHEGTQGVVVGVVSAFQRSRDIVKLVKGQGAIAMACAALKQDGSGDVLGIGALFGLP
jgi:hypothetical protein